MNKQVLTAILFALFSSACAVGPDYARPASELPDDWQAGSEAAADRTDLGQWWTAFNDPALVAVIEESLAHNNDLKAAVANVDAAAAALRLARADYLPTVNGVIDGTRTKASTNSALPLGSAPYTEYSAGLLVNYELDIWGRVRRANEAAIAELNRDVAVRDGVHSAVAAATAQAWFQARALDRQVALLERLHETRIDNLRLQQTRLDAGLIPPYDFEQARSETAAVAAQLPVLRAARLQALTALAVLRGATPQAMVTEWSAERARAETALAAVHVLPVAPAVPMDLPSALLERRPDVRAAEQRLVASNARIGVAKAAYFPRLSLTGFAGGISTAFSSLFESPSESWQASVALAQPLTDINRVGASVNAATARHAAETANYSSTVQRAFKETLDALTGVSTAREVMRAQDERVAALTNAYRVAEARYQAGRIGYLDVLDVERQLREIEQQQVVARLSLLQATVDLYRALGGGWQDSPVLADTR